MKNYLSASIVLVFLFQGVVHAETLEEYMEPRYNHRAEVGDPDRGVDFDLTEGWSGRHDDKITSIIFYMAKNHNHINGIKIKYLYGETTAIGSTNGNKNEKNLNDDEYINDAVLSSAGTGGRTVCTRSGARVSKAKFGTTDGRELWFGKDRSSAANCWAPPMGLSPEDRRLIGFYGTYDNGKIVSLAPVWVRALDLELKSFEVHSDAEGIVYQDAHFLRRIGLNDGDAVQEPMSYTLTYEAYESTTNSWEQSQGVTSSMGLTIGLETEIAGVTGSTEFSFSTEESFSETVGEETNWGENVIMETETSLATPPRTVYGVTAQFDRVITVIPYTATYVNLHNDQEFEVDGHIEDITWSEGFVIWSKLGTFTDGGQALIERRFEADFDDNLTHIFGSRSDLSFTYVD
jgi:hypothetical protein